jgi:hypothetical protein
MINDGDSLKRVYVSIFMFLAMCAYFNVLQFLCTYMYTVVCIKRL